MNMLRRGANHLLGRLKAHASVKAYYWENDRRSAPIEPSRAKDLYESVDADGFVTTVEYFNFRLYQADLTIAGRPIQPAVGGRFEVLEGSKRTWFEVKPPPGLPAVEMLDSDELGWLIHTIRLQNE